MGWASQDLLKIMFYVATFFVCGGEMGAGEGVNYVCFVFVRCFFFSSHEKQLNEIKSYEKTKII